MMVPKTLAMELKKIKKARTHRCKTSKSPTTKESQNTLESSVKMPNPTQSSLLSTLLLVAAILPWCVLGSLQHSWMPLDKRSSAQDGSNCYHDYATDPANCPIVHVAFFEDASCNKPLELARTTPQAMIKGNEQMIWEGTVAHSLKRPLGSMRVLAAVQGIGIGFAKEEESDGVVQNTAWMSSSKVYDAFKTKDCITLPNLDVHEVGVWTARVDSITNQGAYVWNPDNIPIKNGVAQCAHASTDARHKRRSRGTASGRTRPICLEQASYAGGAVLLLYSTDDCTGPAEKQLYSTMQCTPLRKTSFKSYKAIQPKGPTIDTVFSPIYYDLNANELHACAQRDVSARPFKPNACQKMFNTNMFVGVYGVDPSPEFPQPVPSPGDKVLLQSHGHLLLSPNPEAGGKGLPHPVKP